MKLVRRRDRERRVQIRIVAGSAIFSGGAVFAVEKIDKWITVYKCYGVKGIALYCYRLPSVRPVSQTVPVQLGCDVAQVLSGHVV